MEQRITMIGLGVADVSAALSFYRDGLGWTPSSASEGDFVLFTLSGGVGLVLYPRRLLAEDAGVSDVGGFGGVTLSHNVASRSEVDELIARAVSAGATRLSGPEGKPWGYTGYFADPDGHPWEIAFVPSLPLHDGMLATD